MIEYDRIKTMTVDEMAAWLEEISQCKCCVRKDRPACSGIYCKLNIKRWLEQEAAE